MRDALRQTLGPQPRQRRRPAVLLLLLLPLLPPLLHGAGSAAQTPADDGGARADSALRYVSLRAAKAYMRKGPGTNYPIARVYQRAGLPVEVIRQFDVWRQVRDAQGTVGWMHSSLLSVRRTALVLPWEIGQSQPAQGEAGTAAAPRVDLRADGNADARVVAQAAAGELVAIVGCERGWCEVELDGRRGYVEQAKLWGTYPNETIR